MRMAADTAGSPRQSRHPPPFGVAGGEQPGEEDRSAGGMFGRHAHTGSEELEQLKRKLIAAAYTSHGVDLGALFESYDLDHDGALQLAELGPHLQKMLPGVLSKQQEDKLLAAMDVDSDGSVTLAELRTFVETRDIGHGNAEDASIAVEEFDEDETF